MALSWLTPDMLLEDFDPAFQAESMLPPVVKPIQTVGDLMTEEVVFVSPATSLEEARQKLRAGGFRHLPVCEGGKLVGVVTDRDLLRQAQGVVRQVMTRKVWTAHRSTPILTAAHLMAEHRVGCLPVLGRDHQLLGILAASDVLRCLSFHAPVQAWM